MMLPAVEGPGQAGVIVKQKRDAISNLLSMAVPGEKGADWHEHPVHWPAVPPSGHQQRLFQGERQRFYHKMPSTDAAVLGQLMGELTDGETSGFLNTKHNKTCGHFKVCSCL